MNTCEHYRVGVDTKKSGEVEHRMRKLIDIRTPYCALITTRPPVQRHFGQKKLTCGGDLAQCTYVEDSGLS